MSQSPNDPPGDDDEDVAADDTDEPKPVTREELRAYLDRPATVAWVNAHVASAVSERFAQEIAQDALLEAWISAPPDDQRGLKSWLRTIVDRVIAKHHEKRNRRKKYEGAMPVTPVRVDEAGEPVPDTDDEGLVDIDPSFDPEKTDFRVEGWLLRRYLQGAIAGNARDEETLRWMIAWADGEKTYQQIADEARLPLTTVSARVFQFKSKYGPRFARYRNGLIIILLVLTAALAVLALRELLPARKPVPTIGPVPQRELAPPAPPVQPSPPRDTQFEPAAPTPSSVPPSPDPDGKDLSPPPPRGKNLPPSGVRK